MLESSHPPLTGGGGYSSRAGGGGGEGGKGALQEERYTRQAGEDPILRWFSISQSLHSEEGGAAQTYKPTSLHTAGIFCLFKLASRAGHGPRSEALQRVLRLGAMGSVKMPPSRRESPQSWETPLD